MHSAAEHRVVAPTGFFAHSATLIVLVFLFCAPGCGSCEGAAGAPWDVAEEGGLQSGGGSLADADVIFGNRFRDGLGYGVEYPGDVDGDGFDDLLIAHRKCCRDSGDHPERGAVMLVYGGAELPREGLLGTQEDSPMFRGERSSDGLGLRAKRIGDIDGDGFDDIAIGVRRLSDADVVQKSAGAVYVFYGSDRRFAGEIDLADADLIIEGEPGQRHFSRTVTGADLDGDGRNEVVIGGAVDESGAASVSIWSFPSRVHGRRTASEADSSITGEAGATLFGFDVAGTDFDGDGVDELAIGVVSNPLGVPEAGGVCLLRDVGSGVAQDESACESVHLPSASREAGTIVTRLGEIDGPSNLVVSDTSSRTLLLAGESGSASNIGGRVILTGEDMFQFPGAVSAGDVNGDGFEDIVVAGRREDGPNDAGTVYLFYGGNERLAHARDTSHADASFDGVTSGGLRTEAVGGAVTARGDLNGDGYADIAIAADGEGDDGGRVYVVYGRPGLSVPAL